MTTWTWRRPVSQKTAWRLMVTLAVLQIAFISTIVALLGPTVIHVIKLLSRILEKAAA